MNVMLCETSSKEKYNAVKARKDLRDIVSKLDYIDIALFHNTNPKLIIALEIIINSIMAVFKAQKDDIVFIQYPYYPDIVNKILFIILLFGKKVKKYKVTMLIHDILSLRVKYDSEVECERKLKKEVSRWKWMDTIICHTQSMKDKLYETGIKNNYLILGPFYYLYSGKVLERSYSNNPTIMIAGCLEREKAGYIYKLNNISKVKFDLYGLGYKGESAYNIEYCGSFPSDELISHLNGQFGLVWDGNSIDTCDGATGNYLRYNCPHKFSLYLAAGVPVIVWSESALAEYVEENNVGVCVNSLKELPDILNKISEQEYSQMCRNVLEIRKRIIAGDNLKEILSNYS